jgi:cyclopropane-fatty-acyl-phospholipid synthase
MTSNLQSPTPVAAPETLPHGDVLRPLLVGPIDRAPARWPASLVRRRLLTAGSGIVDGLLDVTLVDGSSIQLGDPNHPRRARVEVRSDRIWLRLLRNVRMAPGECFVEGLWESDDPATVLEILARTTERRRLEAGRMPYGIARWRPHLPRRTDPARARSYVSRHYDLGNDLFESFLDPTMTYSCAIFDEDATTLEQAQHAKYERICRKLQLQPGTHLLEIGCGWGGFAMHAATVHGVRVTAVTISERQHEYASARVHAAGLDELVDIQLVDYRTLRGRWDRIASIEMFEAIGEREFPTFFATVDRLLAEDGIACMQTIAVPDRRWPGYRRTNDWIQRYVFPGGLLPSLEAITRSMRRASELHVHDVEEIGIHYAPTLQQWRLALLTNRDQLLEAGYDERFQRIWEYYLAFCEAGFRARILRNVQLVLTRPMNDGIDPVRAV